MYSIGLMSGTSMDGIDVALVNTDGTPHLIKHLHHYAHPYQQIFKLTLKATEFAIKTCQGNLNEATLHFEHLINNYFYNKLGLTKDDVKSLFNKVLMYFIEAGITTKDEPLNLRHIIAHSTQLHATAVQVLLQQTRLMPQNIDIIGYHGQAMFHQPNQKISVILGDGQALANILSIPVINDFRAQDIQQGGQGAPFAPIYHQALAIRDNKIPLAVVNCGGIANLTLIATPDPFQLVGFDTGPGNGLLDQFVRQRTQGKLSMDADGAFGQCGQVIEPVLKALYAKSVIKDDTNYFSLPPPKSLDYGDLILIPELSNLSIEDGCRTLAAFTADSIVSSAQQWSQSALPKHWILAGGGWHNPVILKEIKKQIYETIDPQASVLTANEAGWHNGALEAELFAYLAVRSLHQQPISYPNTTGTMQATTGGSYYGPSSIGFASTNLNL